MQGIADVFKMESYLALRDKISVDDHLLFLEIIASAYERGWDDCKSFVLGRIDSKEER